MKTAPARLLLVLAPCYQPLGGHYYSQGCVMKKSSIGAVFLLSSSALANPYKSEFVEVAFQIQEGKNTFRFRQPTPKTSCQSDCTHQPSFWAAPPW